MASRFTYSDAHLTFLKHGYREMQIPELTLAFNEKFQLNKSETTIKSCLQNHKFTCGRPVGNPKGTYIAYTQEQADYLRESYKEKPLREVVADFNARFGTSKSFQQIRAFTRNHALNSGRTGQFEKGNKPWNTGTKGATSANSGSFKKGGRPKSYLPVGSERTAKGGYIKVKIADPNVWRFKHHLVYEKNNGPIPPGHIVTFKDFDITNFDSENIVAITKAENAIRNKNKIKELPVELRRSVELVAKIHTRKKQLIRQEDPNMKKGAIFSKDRTYRYELNRYWDHDLPVLMVVGLNPSTADEDADDPTVRRLISFASSWGFGGIRLNNLFAYRSTDPKSMLAQSNPIGEHNGDLNDAHLAHNALVCPMILVCWGTFGSHDDRDKDVLSMLRKSKPVHCLAVNADGSPKHPLYVKSDTQPVEYNPGKE